MFFSSMARRVSAATRTAGARPALAAIKQSEPYVRAKPSAIWLRQELPMHTNRTRVIPVGVIAGFLIPKNSLPYVLQSSCDRVSPQLDRRRRRAAVVGREHSDTPEDRGH